MAWQWEGVHFEFDHVDCYTDENGVWEWNEAPIDAFEADICPRGRMPLTDQLIFAREKEHLFQPPEMLVITGRVLEKESGDPVTNYRVTPGRRNPDLTIGIDRYQCDAYQSETPQYRVEFNRTSEGYLVRIEADGYRVATSRNFKSGEGDVCFDFQLERAEPFTGRIVDVEG